MIAHLDPIRTVLRDGVDHRQQLRTRQPGIGHQVQLPMVKMAHGTASPANALGRRAPAQEQLYRSRSSGRPSAR